MMVALQVAGIEVTPPINEEVEAELKAAAAKAASLVAEAENELLHASSLLSKATAIMQESVIRQSGKDAARVERTALADSR